MQVHRDTFAQMISVLLDNAVKYTPEGGTILFSIKSEAGHVWILEENDCELPHNPDPERLFDRFYRSDSAQCDLFFTCHIIVAGEHSANQLAEVYCICRQFSLLVQLGKGQKI